MKMYCGPEVITTPCPKCGAKVGVWCGASLNGPMCHETRITLHTRRSLCENPVTLDGLPARISGAQKQFALLQRSDGKGGVVEFAWETVAHIVANRNGEFFS